MYGYTGTYQGRPISVMGSGMGMPSIGIYSYELYTQYGVENIIRIGSAGSYTDKAKLFDVVLATGAYSESNYAVTQSGDTDDIQTPSAALNDALRASAKAAGIPLIEGNIHPPTCLPPAQRREADLLGKTARRKGLPGRRDGELCTVPQRQGPGQACRLPVDDLRQLCFAGDHDCRAAPDQLHRHDEGRAGR